MIAIRYQPAVILLLTSIGCATAPPAVPEHFVEDSELCHPSPATRPVIIPDEIRDFQAEIHDAGPEQVYAAAIARFGRPTRVIGTGIYLPQWDVAGGTLTAFPDRVPRFETESRQTVWLNETENRADESLFFKFGLWTPPSVSGTLHIARDLTYRFVDS